MVRVIIYHTFITRLMPRRGTVVDLGGNHGEFTQQMRRLFDARAYVVEPVPALYNLLPCDKSITNIKAAVSGKNGQTKIFFPEGGCPTVSLGAGGMSIVAREYKYSDLIADYKIKKIDLLKIDIEGAEISLIDSLVPDDFKRISQCTVEFHDFIYPKLKPKVEQLKKKFQKNGFYCIAFSFRNNGDILFVRRDLIRFWEYVYLKYFLRFFLGVKRRANRYISDPKS